MGSMLWTDEESRYLKAIFSWQDRQQGERAPTDRSRTLASAADKASVGEFRVLLIGPKGVGKTALVTRFCNGSLKDAAPDPRFERGGRRTLEIDQETYMMDILELPSEHLNEEVVDENGKARASPMLKGKGKKKEQTDSAPVRTSLLATSPAALMLEQALAITEAAVVVYDVTNEASFRQACRLYKHLLQRHAAAQSPSSPVQARGRAQRHAQKLGPAQEKGPHVLVTKPSRRFHKLRKSDAAAAAAVHAIPEHPETPETTTARASLHPSLASSVRPPRPFTVLLVGNKNDADDSTRAVSWADGSKAALAAAALIKSGSRGTGTTRHVLSKPPPPEFLASGRPLTSRASANGNETRMDLPSSFLEASAKSGDHVTAVFEHVGRNLLRQKQALQQRLQRERQDEAALAALAAPSTATSTSPMPALQRMRSHSSVVLGRRFGVFSALIFPFSRRSLAADGGTT